MQRRAFQCAEKDAANTLSMLKSAPGAAFDTAYMNAQVDEHQKVALMPNAKNADLKSYLADIEPTVESHLKNVNENSA
jgi:predicted outer membrane protein